MALYLHAGEPMDPLNIVEYVLPKLDSCHNGTDDLRVRWKGESRKVCTG